MITPELPFHQILILPILSLSPPQQCLYFGLQKLIADLCFNLFLLVFEMFLLNIGLLVRLNVFSFAPTSFALSASASLLSSGVWTIIVLLLSGIHFSVCVSVFLIFRG